MPSWPGETWQMGAEPTIGARNLHGARRRKTATRGHVDTSGTDHISPQPRRRHVLNVALLSPPGGVAALIRRHDNPLVHSRRRPDRVPRRAGPQSPAMGNLGMVRANPVDRSRTPRYGRGILTVPDV